MLAMTSLWVEVRTHKWAVFCKWIVLMKLFLNVVTVLLLLKHFKNFCCLPPNQFKRFYNYIFMIENLMFSQWVDHTVALSSFSRSYKWIVQLFSLILVTSLRLNLPHGHTWDRAGASLLEKNAFSSLFIVLANKLFSSIRGFKLVTCGQVEGYRLVPLHCISIKTCLCCVSLCYILYILRFFPAG